MLFEKHQKYIRGLLEALRKEPLRYKKLLQCWLAANSNQVQFVKCMKWMLEKGYIRKQNSEKRFSPYEITESGEKYLTGLEA